MSNFFCMHNELNDKMKITFHYVFLNISKVQKTLYIPAAEGGEDKILSVYQQLPKFILNFISLLSNNWFNKT